MSDPRKIVSDFQTAMGKGDFAAARKLLRDDVSFRGPIGNFEGAEPLMKALERLQNIVERAEIKKIFNDGDDVCVLFDLVAKAPGDTAFVAEWYRVSGSKIVMMRAAADARPSSALFAGSPAS